MKIGIFLGYDPHVVLKKEGLGRYLGGLLRGFTDNGHEIVIVSPRWLKKSLSELLTDFGLDEKRIIIESTKKTPPLWRLFEKVVVNKSRRKIIALINKISSCLTNVRSSILKEMATTDSMMIFIILLLLFGLCACLVLGVVAVGLLKCFSTPGASLLFATISVITGVALLFYRKKHIRKRLWQYKNNGLSGLINSLRDNLFIANLFKLMCDAEVRRLVSVANGLREKPDCWFVPTIFWPQAAELKTAPVVFNAPDLIPEIFAIGFAGKASLPNFADCRKTLRAGKWFITYDEYVRNSLLIEENRLSPEYSFAIRHVNNDMSPYLAVHEDLNRQNNTDKDFSKAFALNFLGSYKKTRYIFFASQLRASKNILNLIKAFEFLLRIKFVYIKLVLTANLRMDKTIVKYISERSLQNEVVSFCNVPAQHLAALYSSAELVVNPTLYEGSFPFTFGEGMSVGTPSIMSDIPQSREVLEPAGLEEIMFDPYDWRSIAEKIEWALDRRQELYEKELPLYKELAKRTPEVVAAEYVKTFEHIIEQEKQVKLQGPII